VSAAPKNRGPSEATTGRLALSKSEAAAALGVSVDFLEQHVIGELRVVRRGRRRLIPVGELERWLDTNAALAIPSPVPTPQRIRAVQSDGR
jgi:excisionase family DNA binding protein